MLAFNFGFLFLPEIHGQDQIHRFKITTDSPDLFLVKIQLVSYHKIIIDPLLFFSIVSSLYHSLNLPRQSQ